MVEDWSGVRRFCDDFEALDHPISCIFIEILAKSINSLFSYKYWLRHKLSFQPTLFSIRYWEQPSFLTSFCVAPVSLILIDKSPIHGTRGEASKGRAIPAQTLEAVEEETISRKGAESEKAPRKPSRGSRRLFALWRLGLL